MSFIPYTADMPTGYILDSDSYVIYSEYYGDGTVYGLRHISLPDGSPSKGLGPAMSRVDLVAKEVVVPEEGGVPVGIDICVVPAEGPCEVPTPSVPEVAPEVAPPAESAAVEKMPTKVVVKLGGVSVVLNKVLEKDIVVNVNEAEGVVEFVL